jgi:hypothetical protein
MTSKQFWLQNTPLHPLFFAIYPILALLAFNSSELNFSVGLRALFLSILLAIVLFLIFLAIYRDSRKSALVSSVILVLIFSYGHIYSLLKGIQIAGINPFRHRTLLPLWLVLAALTVGWVARRLKNLVTVTYTLNMIGLFLLILPVFQLTSFFVRSTISDASAEANPTTLNLKVGNPPPDIYYIILDGYGRSDVLKKYGYDNSDFLNSLRDLGFYVADCAQSNYAQTKLSLTSSLNFNYVDALDKRFAAGSDDRTGMDALIHHSAVRKSLEKAGYKTIGFATGFTMTELTDADHYLAPQNSWVQLNDFESLLVKTVTGGLVQEQDSSLEMPNSSPELSRERTLFTLDKLDEVPDIAGPKFVFVHLVIPHPPFVFGPTGGPRAPEQDGLTRTEQTAIFYRDQAIYISSRIMEIVPRIIANSDTPPIIVIQGDHGPTSPSVSQERMSILNAYLLPGVDAPLYSTITPVNTFRIIFNTYFGQNLELLDDISLYSHYRHPFDYKVIPNSCRTNN